MFHIDILNSCLKSDVIIYNDIEDYYILFEKNYL